MRRWRHVNIPEVSQRGSRGAVRLVFEQEQGSPIAMVGDLIHRREVGHGRGDASKVRCCVLQCDIRHRPALQDLSVRIELERTFGSAPLTGLTFYPVIYGARITIGSGTYELRAQGHGGPLSQGGGMFGLFECAGQSRTEVAKLSGGFGTVGEAVVAAIPLWPPRPRTRR